MYTEDAYVQAYNNSPHAKFFNQNLLRLNHIILKVKHKQKITAVTATKNQNPVLQSNNFKIEI